MTQLNSGFKSMKEKQKGLLLGGPASLAKAA